MDNANSTSKLKTIEEVIARIESGMSIMLGGFFWCGAPFSLVCGLTEREGQLKDLTLISNDALSAPNHPESYGNAMIASGIIKKCVASFIGHNHVALDMIGKGLLELEMVPMGTLAERIRSGGAGIGGFLIKTGMGTDAAEGKRIIQVDDEDYILEKPIKADVAFIYGSRVDENGNVELFGTARNYNVAMATAADYVVVEAREIVKSGEIDPSNIAIPAPYIDAIVPAREDLYTSLTW